MSSILSHGTVRVILLIYLEGANIDKYISVLSVSYTFTDFNTAIITEPVDRFIILFPIYQRNFLQVLYNHTTVSDKEL